MAKVTGKEWKEWAKEHMRGMENVAMPSFTPDLNQLDEAGIRWDVQNAIAHGFFSTNSPGRCGYMTMEERKRHLAIVCDEAGDDILVGIMTQQDHGSWEEMIEFAQYAEQIGVTHAMISYPSWYFPETLEQVYQDTRRLCEAANIGFIVWATASDDRFRFHPSSVPFELFDRLVELPNVMAMKVGFAEPGMVYEVFERYGDKIQVNIGHPTMLGMIPTLKRRYAPQWAGAGMWELWQSPEKPMMVEMFDHFINGRYPQALKLYWSFVASGTLGFFGGNDGYNIASIDTGHGFIDWTTAKYFHWTVGGNGGPVRHPAKPLTQRTIAARMAMLKRLGLTLREPLEEFLVGRAAYQQNIAE